jgi:hypothetical protein
VYNSNTNGSSANISSTGNQYFAYASAEMEIGAISAATAPNVVTLRIIGTSGSSLSQVGRLSSSFPAMR